MGHGSADWVAGPRIEHQLEALDWMEGSRRWLDHGLRGDVDLALAVEAANRLLVRAGRWLEVAAA